MLKTRSRLTPPSPLPDSPVPTKPPPMVGADEVILGGGTQFSVRNAGMRLPPGSSSVARESGRRRDPSPSARRGQGGSLGRGGGGSEDGRNGVDAGREEGEEEEVSTSVLVGRERQRREEMRRKEVEKEEEDLNNLKMMSTRDWIIGNLTMKRGGKGVVATGYGDLSTSEVLAGAINCIA